MVEGARLLGIDWGTSNRRAYLIDAAGVCLRRHEDQQGALAVQGHFNESLHALRHLLDVGEDLPVVMSGMVGSAHGWQEVAYLDSCVPLARLADTLVPVAGSEACYIVPGYCHHGDGVDVMRGEETQLLGACALGSDDGCYVLPGTHSKWVQLAGGRIVRLATYMTGELFAALRSGGTLAALMAGGEAGEESGLRQGAQRAQRRQPLSHSLFEARARVVADGVPARETSAYVSGLLIGAEFAAEQPVAPGETIHLLASDALCAPYVSVARNLGVATHVIDPHHAYCAALALFWEAIQPWTSDNSSRH